MGYENFTSKINGAINATQGHEPANLLVTTSNPRFLRAEATPTIPVIDGRNHSASIAVTWFIIGSIVIGGLYYLARNAYRSLRYYCLTSRKPQEISKQESSVRRNSSAKLMVKEEHG